MIDHIWRERLALSDRLMCVAKCDPTLFAHLCRMESLRRSAHRHAQAAARSPAQDVMRIRASKHGVDSSLRTII